MAETTMSDELSNGSFTPEQRIKNASHCLQRHLADDTQPQIIVDVLVSLVNACIDARAIIADPLPKDGEADRTLHEEVVSDARKLAHEINEDVMAGEDEIAAAIEAGFSFRERRLKARIEALLKDESRGEG